MDTIKLTFGGTGITSPLFFNGVSQLQKRYVLTITAAVQNQLSNCVMFDDLSFNNNLIYVKNSSSVNGL